MFRTSHILLKLFLTAVVAGCLLLIYLDAKITSTFVDKMWEVPAKVYARPLELFSGARLGADELAYELEVLGYRKVAHTSRAGAGRPQPGALRNLHAGIYLSRARKSPPGGCWWNCSGQRVQAITAGNRGVDLMRLDPVQIGGIYPLHGEDRVLVRLEDVPATLRDGLLATEDHRFYDHWGISLIGIARAAWSNMRSGQVVAGGSTITQQLVKNYYLTPERTIVRKVTEVLMAILLDLHYEKDQILESYINEVYLGQEGRRSIHGFALAARHYFDTPLGQLGLHQQALLIGMIKGPIAVQPQAQPRARASSAATWCSVKWPSRA